MKEKPLEGKAALPRTETKCILLFLGKPVPLPELAERRSGFFGGDFLSQTDFFNCQCRVFVQFCDGRDLK